MGSRSGTSAPVLARYVRGDTAEEADQLRARLDGAASTRRGLTAPTISLARTYGPCTLEPGTVYLRKEYQYKAVGTKPITRCVTPVTAIVHRTDMRYHWYNWWLRAGETFTGDNENQRVYRSKKIHVTCVGRQPTVWSGTTLGKVIYRGHTYFARVYQEARELNCGADWP